MMAQQHPSADPVGHVNALVAPPMPTGSGELHIPELPEDVDAMKAAELYAAGGLYVLPIRKGGKHPGSVVGKRWHTQSTRDLAAIVGHWAGTDHGVALHLGRSQALGFDIDRPEAAPDVLVEAIADLRAPCQITRPDQPGRIHALFAMPPGRMLGNSTGGLGKAWGEVRGRNGVFVVAPSIHADAQVGAEYRWQRTGAIPALPDELAELLPDADPAEDAADDATVAAFGATYTTETRPGSLRGVLRTFDAGVAGGGSRHDAAVSATCWAAREAVKGYYAAERAHYELGRAFTLAMAQARGTERLLDPGQSAAEFASIWAWAVSQALARIDELERDRHDEAQTAPATTEPMPATPAADAIPEQRTAFEDEGEDPESYERALELEVRKQRMRREAQAILAAENREPLRVMTAAEFLASPDPEYLVPKMLYRDGLAVVFGQTGAAKSFLVLDVALCVATGTPWRGRDLERGRVHYVMAEGQATNKLRTLAWLHHHGVDRAALEGQLVPVPQAVILTEAGITDYLEVVRRDQPTMIVLDTKNLMFVGKESAGDDYGAMLRVLHTLRQAAGGACVVLIDHSGLGDDTRTRGSNAQKGGVDTEVRVVQDEQGLRQVEVTKDKSGAVGAHWTFKLHQIPEVPRPPDVDAPAVCVPAELDDVAVSPFAKLRESWGELDHLAMPDEVANLAGRGKEAARDIFRVLRWVDDSDGLTLTQIRQALEEGTREHSKAAVFAAKALLVERGIVLPGVPASKLVLSPMYVLDRSVDPA